MNCKTLILLLFGFCSIAAFAETAIEPKEILSAIKSASNEKTIISSLSKLGLSDSIINAFSNYAISESQKCSIFNKKNLIRTDIFKCNLDESSDSEYVSQIIFQIGNEKENTAERFYLIFVNSPKVNNYRPIWNNVYKNSLCNMLTSGKTAFKFVAAKGMNYSLVLFQRNIVESCGMVLSAFDQMDTLKCLDKKFEFIKGKKFNEFYTNRNDVTE